MVAAESTPSRPYRSAQRHQSQPPTLAIEGVNPCLERLLLVWDSLSTDEDLVRAHPLKPVVLRRKTESDFLPEDLEATLGTNGDLVTALPALQCAHAAGDPKVEQQNGNLPSESGGGGRERDVAGGARASVGSEEASNERPRTRLGAA